MKNFLILLFALSTIFAKAQSITFRDLENNVNADSLEKALLKNNTNVYINQLILLENAWLTNRDKRLGTNFKLISELSSKMKRSDVIPILDYLNGRSILLKQRPDMAFKYFNNSLTASRTKKDTVGIISNLLQMVDLNINQTLESYRNLEQAYIYVDEAYKIAKDYKDIYYIFKTNNESIKVYLGDKTKKRYHKKLLDEQKKIIDLNPQYKIFKIKYANNMAKYYYDKGQPEKSYLILKANIFPEKFYGSRFNYCGYLTNLVNLGIDLKKYDEAEKLAYHILDLTKDIELRIIRQRIFEILRRLNENKKDFPQALIYSDSSFAIKEAIFKEESILKLNSLVESLKSKEITTKNKLLEKENQIIKSKNRITSYATIFSILIMVILAVAFYFNYNKNQQISKQSNEIINLAKIKDQYFTIVAHDLKSPLNSYQGLAETIKYLISSKEYDKIESVSHQIDILGEKISLMLNNLLNWSKSQDFSFEPKLVRLSLTNVLTEILQIYIDIAKHRGIKINLGIDDQRLIFADSNTLSVVIRNILDNALKYCYDPKQISVEFQQSHHKNTFDLVIKNSIDNTKVNHLINTINFLNDSKIKPYEGSSIGLELIKKFAKINNVNLFSKMDESFFIIILTFKKAE